MVSMFRIAGNELRLQQISKMFPIMQKNHTAAKVPIATFEKRYFISFRYKRWLYVEMFCRSDVYVMKNVLFSDYGQNRNNPF